MTLDTSAPSINQPSWTHFIMHAHRQWWYFHIYYFLDARTNIPREASSSAGIPLASRVEFPRDPRHHYIISSLDNRLICANSASFPRKNVRCTRLSIISWYFQASIRETRAVPVPQRAALIALVLASHRHGRVPNVQHGPPACGARRLGFCKQRMRVCRVCLSDSPRRICVCVCAGMYL
jgi:hypothetical protein